MNTKYKSGLLFFVYITLTVVLTGCGGGGGSSAGGDTLSGPTTQNAFNVKVGEAYTYRATSVSGNFWFLVYDEDPIPENQVIPSGFSSVFSGDYDNYSFIAKADKTYYVVSGMYDSDPYSFKLSTKNNYISVDGAAISDTTNSDTLYYSFDVEAGLSYEVVLTSVTGDVDIGSVSPNMDMSGSLGSSTRSGSTADMFGFTATTTGRHYVRVASTSTETSFNIKVQTITTEPDLVVEITQAGSDGVDMTINYTVYNNGIDASAGFELEAWADAFSSPASGTVGDATNAYSSLPGYSSISGSFIIPDSSPSGSAYLSVDNANAVNESDENNNVSAATNWVVTKSDLTVSIYDVSSNGQDVTVRYTVTNAGARSSDAYTVELWADSVSVPVIGDFGDTVVNKTALAGGQSSSASVVIPNVSSFGNAYAIVDTTDIIDEEVETNNVSPAAPWVTTYPDMDVVITNVTANGVNIIIDYTVTNNGNNVSGDFTVDFFGDSLSAPGVGATGDISANHTSLYMNYQVSGTVEIPSAAVSGTAYAIVDTGSLITESDETNNVSAGAGWTANYPDLQIAVDRVISDGVNADIYYRITNEGNNDAMGIVNVKVWADSITPPTAGDVADGSNSHDFATYPLSTLGYASGKVTVPTALLQGSAYVIVDTDDAIIETDETNNVSSVNNWAITTVSADSFIAIPDNDQVTGASAAITLSGVTTSISKVVVGLNIWHDYAGDVDIYLESPSGTIIEISTDNDACGGGNYGDSSTDTLFDDSSTESIIYSNDCFYNDVYKPEQLLSDLNGEDANGTWILHVYDDTDIFGTGTLRKFTLAVQ